MTNYYNLVVEGDTDEAALLVILDLANAAHLRTYGKHGKRYIETKLDSFRQAAASIGDVRWLVLVDLDNETCAPLYRERLLDSTPPNLLFRVAVRELEAWLLADRNRIAAFLGVSVALVPREPERLADPKLELINLARRSRKSHIRHDLVPLPGGGRSEGPAYTSRIIDFILGDWDPVDAAVNSPSLRRLIEHVGGPP